jgi:DNA-directed RNA polymerase specialized sigma24 family protein
MVAVERARQGDCELLLEATLSNVSYWSWSFSRSTGVAVEDLKQEIALRLFVKIERIVAARNPMAYARVTALNSLRAQYDLEVRRRRLAQERQTPRYCVRCHKFFVVQGARGMIPKYCGKRCSDAASHARNRKRVQSVLSV